MSLLLAIAGPPGSGKTSISRELEQEYGFVHISGSDIIKQSHALLDPETRPPLDTRADITAYQKLWKEREGLDAVGAAVLRIMENAGEKARVCYDGPRNKFDAQRIKQSHGIIVALHCDVRERHKRFIQRSNNSDLTLEQFKNDEKDEYASADPLGLHLTEVMRSADIQLNSSHPLPEIISTLKMSLQQIGITL